jgi:predicted helicase
LFYRGGNVNFPLYLYPDKTKSKSLDEKASKPERTPNFTTEFLHALKEVLGAGPTPEEIFYYIYVVLYSPTYRKRYEAFLKTDFPRIRFTKDYTLFKKMGEMGKKLADLHLMKSDELNNPIAKFQGSGENRVEKRRYDEGAERVYVNKTQYFEGIENKIWEYQIGGYQVLDKWLKDRKERELSLEDIKHYCKVVTAIRKTIEVQKAIDQSYPEIEEEVIEFSIQKEYTVSLEDIP